MNERRTMDQEQMNPEQTKGQSDTNDGLTTADIAFGKNSQTTNEASRTEGQAVDEEPLIPDVAIHRQKWESIQARFVDEPNESVKEADGLVAEVIQQLATRFAEERQKLEKQWQASGQASTEDLRVALQHYRSFFQRLLAA